MNIHISASELAILTGHNSYKDKKELYIKFWKKYWRHDYDSIISEYSVKNKKPKLPETSSQTISRMAKEHNIPKETISEIYSASKKDTTSLMLKTKNAAINKTLKNIPKKHQEEFLKSANSLTYTNFGTKNESTGIDVYNSIKSVDVTITNKYFHNDIFIIEESEGHPDIWSLGGKIDGIVEIDGEEIIVEIKNRMRGLFNSLRDYEKVQCFAYMFILNKKCVHLAEYYKQNLEEDDRNMNIIEIKWDDNFWYNEVLNKLSLFVDDFYKFLESHQKKIDILS